MKKRTLVILCLSICTLIGCAHGRFHDVSYVESKPLPPDKSIQGVSYYLPQTALEISVPVTLNEYKNADPAADDETQYFRLEVSGDITVTPVLMPDPNQAYFIESEHVSDNSFLYSNLTFNFSKRATLSGATGNIQDKRLDAFKAAVQLVSNIAKTAAGLGLAEAPGRSPKLELVEARGTFNHKETFVPFGIGDEYELQLGNYVAGVANGDVDEVKIQLADVLPSGSRTSYDTNSTVPEPKYKKGIFYRVPTFVRTDVTHKSCTNGVEQLSYSYVSYMQFGPIHSLPVGGKPFTDRTTTIAFNDDGSLGSYASESHQSADKVLSAANEALTTASTAYNEIQTMRAQAAQKEAERRAAEQKELIERAQQVKALVDCLKTKSPSACADLFAPLLQ